VLNVMAAVLGMLKTHGARPQDGGLEQKRDLCCRNRAQRASSSVRTNTVAGAYEPRHAHKHRPDP